eukprot:3673180-Prymnesium_polylepis.1
MRACRTFHHGPCQRRVGAAPEARLWQQPDMRRTTTRAHSPSARPSPAGAACSPAEGTRCRSAAPAACEPRKA